MERKEKQMKLLESKGGFAVSFSKEGQGFAGILKQVRLCRIFIFF